MSYEQIREAAERRHHDDSSTTWKLADAILGEVPEIGSGNAPSRGRLADALESLALKLEDDGVRTPNGDIYTAKALDHLRDTALWWRPGTTRHPEAAFRTHQEAGSPTTPGGIMLHALCAYARGERVKRPQLGVIGTGKDRREPDQEAWERAIAGVKRKRGLSRTPRYLVAANDLRYALQRLGNIPETQRDQKAKEGQDKEAAAHRLTEVVEDLGPETTGTALADVSPEAAREAALALPDADLVDFDPAREMADDTGHLVSDACVGYHWAAVELARVVRNYTPGSDPVADQALANALNDTEELDAAIRAALGIKESV